MRFWIITALLLSVVAPLPSPAEAGNNAQAGIVLHLYRPPQVEEDRCTSAAPGDISEINYSDLGYTCYGDYMSAYILVCNGSHRNAEVLAETGFQFDEDGSGVAGATFGLTYDPGILVFDWYLCADAGFTDTDWPASGTGGTFTWNSEANCKALPSPVTAPEQVMAVIGVLHIWAAPGFIQITPHAVSETASILDCYGIEDRIDDLYPSHLGAAGFCSPGYTPCSMITPVEETTWGSIKKHFY